MSTFEVKTGSHRSPLLEQPYCSNHDVLVRAFAGACPFERWFHGASLRVARIGGHPGLRLFRPGAVQAVKQDVIHVLAAINTRSSDRACRCRLAGSCINDAHAAYERTPRCTCTAAVRAVFIHGDNSTAAGRPIGERGDRLEIKKFHDRCEARGCGSSLGLSCI